MNLHRAILLGSTIAAFAACGVKQQDPAASDNDVQVPGETGMALSTAVDQGSDTDVASVKYDIKRVACNAGDQFEAVTRTVTVPLESMKLPGGIAAFDNSPLDQSSEHPFSDHFEVLPAGCYDVTGTPQTSAGADSSDCSSATQHDVQVTDGMTTEIFLISQCKGAEVGAIDTVVTLNKPPTIGNLTFTPSKFIAVGDTDTVCVTASDPDGDPLEFTWNYIGNDTCSPPGVVSTNTSGSDTTQCVTIAPDAAGGYWFEVKVYDQVHDENGNLVRVEDWLHDHGYPSDSHDSLQFPVYVGATK